MNDALYIAATGMRAQNAQLDSIANNVANASTPNFKRSSLRFGDLVSAAPMPVEGASPAATPAGVLIGSVQHSLTAGELQKVDDPMALAVQGEGFLEVSLADGSTAFSRGGRLSLNAERLLSTADGHPLRQRIHVAPDIRQVEILDDGTVQGLDEQGRSTNLGRLDLTLFAQPAALSPIGDGLWQAGSAAGDARVAQPGEAGAGLLKQGFQEASNVRMLDEIVQLMVAQRAYQMNVRVMQAADEIASLANSLRKGS